MRPQAVEPGLSIVQALLGSLHCRKVSRAALHHRPGGVSQAFDCSIVGGNFPDGMCCLAIDYWRTLTCQEGLETHQRSLDLQVRARLRARHGRQAAWTHTGKNLLEQSQVSDDPTCYRPSLRTARFWRRSIAGSVWSKIVNSILLLGLYRAYHAFVAGLRGCQ